MYPRDVLYESPKDEEGVPASQPQPEKVAAGLPAVVSTARYIVKEPGVVRGTQGLLRLNQDGGVDCPSCAWPDPEKRGLFEFCENGAKALADETTRKRVTPAFFEAHSVEQLSRRSDWWLNNQGRITEPMYLAADSLHYRPISWEGAFSHVARVVKEAAGPERLAFYTSGRASNESAFLYGTLVRMLGTNNLPDCSNLCHESSGSALGKTIGIGKGTVTLEDFNHAELILVVGQNPGTNHPRMLTALEQAKKSGAEIVSINPLPEAGLSRFRNPQGFLNPLHAVGTLVGAGTLLGDLHLPVIIGGDLALFKGLCKQLIEWHEEGRPTLDQAFIDSKTEGFEALAQDLKSTPWEDIAAGSGIEPDQIRDLAAKLAGTEKIIICWAMGLTQHTNSVETITQLVNLLLLRGAFGKPGAGACPVRGHSNVQGDRTVGIFHKPPQPFLDALEKEFGFKPPSEHGYDVAETIEAMDRGEVDLLFSLGGNFLSATPDTGRTAAGLQRCKLTVSVATKLNRSHLVSGREALILPCLGRTETDQQDSGPQFVTVENSMGKVHRSQGTLEPPSPQLRSEVSIVVGLARVLEPDKTRDWERFVNNYDSIREAIEKVIPGFEDYNHRVRQSGGFYLPNGPREGRFTTPSGKAHFTVAPLLVERPRPGHLYLMTMRSHDQFNTVVYGYDDRYRGIKNSRRIVFANADDLRELGLEAGRQVSVESNYQGVARRVDGFTVVAYPIPRGCCAAYFPEANPLVPVEHRDPESGCPASKKIEVRLL